MERHGNLFPQNMCIRNSLTSVRQKCTRPDTNSTTIRQKFDKRSTQVRQKLDKTWTKVRRKLGKSSTKGRLGQEPTAFDRFCQNYNEHRGAGTSFVIVAPAPINAPFPIVTPGSIVALLPIDALSKTVVFIKFQSFLDCISPFAFVD